MATKKPHPARRKNYAKRANPLTNSSRRLQNSSARYANASVNARNRNDGGATMRALARKSESFSRAAGIRNGSYPKQLATNAKNNARYRTAVAGKAIGSKASALNQRYGTQARRGAERAAVIGGASVLAFEAGKSATKAISKRNAAKQRAKSRAAAHPINRTANPNVNRKPTNRGGKRRGGPIRGAGGKFAGWHS